MFRRGTLVVAVMVSSLGFSGCLISSSSPAVSITSSSSSSSGGDTTSSSSSGGGTSLTAAELVSGSGTYGYSESCMPVTDNTYGSLFGTGYYSILRFLSFSSGNYYSLNVDVFYDGAQDCRGVEVMAFQQSGTFALGSATTSPSGGYEITYQPTSDYITVYNGDSGGGSTSFGNTWAGEFNTYCAPMSNPTSGNSAGTTTLNHGDALNCSSDILFSFQNPANTYDDVIIPSSDTSPTSITIYDTGSALFNLGQQGSFPTSATLTLSN